MDTKEKFRINLAKCFEDNKHIKGSDLATKLSVSPPTISRWLAGVSLPQINLYKDICEIFNISINDLLGFGTSELTEEEMNIIELYRKFNTEEKKVVKKMLSQI